MVSAAQNEVCSVVSQSIGKVDAERDLGHLGRAFVITHKHAVKYYDKYNVRFPEHHKYYMIL